MSTLGPIRPPAADGPEAADTLHVCRATLYGLIRTGQLPSLKIGKARRISEAAVATFIADRTVGGDTP